MPRCSWLYLRSISSICISVVNGNLYTLLELNDEVISEITDKINTCSNIEVVDSKLIVQGNTTAMGYDNITIVFNSDGTWKIEE